MFDNQSDEALNKMLFDEECETLEKALAESDNDQIKRSDYTNSVSVIISLGLYFDKERV